VPNGSIFVDARQRFLLGPIAGRKLTGATKLGGAVKKCALVDGLRLTLSRLRLPIDVSQTTAARTGERSSKRLHGSPCQTRGPEDYGDRHPPEDQGAGETRAQREVRRRERRTVHTFRRLPVGPTNRARAITGARRLGRKVDSHFDSQAGGRQPMRWTKAETGQRIVEGLQRSGCWWTAHLRIRNQQVAGSNPAGGSKSSSK